MKKKAIIFLLCFLLLFPRTSSADLFGGDVVVLTQLLVQSLSRYQQLKTILKTGSKNLELLEEVNRGINDILEVYNTLHTGHGHGQGRGVYGDWQNVEEAIRRLERLYGKIPQSQDSEIQRDTDRIAAEAISLNNSINDYSIRIDEIGERLKKSGRTGGSHLVGAENSRFDFRFFKLRQRVFIVFFGEKLNK